MLGSEHPGLVICLITLKWGQVQSQVVIYQKILWEEQLGGSLLSCKPEHFLPTAFSTKAMPAHRGQELEGCNLPLPSLGHWS